MISCAPCLSADIYHCLQIKILELFANLAAALGLFVVM